MRRAIPSLVAFAVLAGFGTIVAQTPAEHSDLASKLAKRLETGEATLEYKNKWGYLQSLLRELDIHTDSQVLVFSRTSLQQEKIGPKTPRAIYFNDTIAVGMVQNGALFEITAADPAGTQFYTLDTTKVDKPKIEGDRSICLACHGYTWAAHTFVATVYPGVDGSPFFMGGDLFHATDHRTPFEERWGGWYVTGTHGKMQHLGNAVAENPYRPVELQTKGTQNQTSLVTKFDVTKYLTPTSDLIALMTLEHQTQAMYYMAALSAQFRTTGAKRPTDAQLDAAVENLVSYLTFADEAKLTSPIKGVSTFTQTFPKRGPTDSKGRSLRDFNLQTRLFQYPLSYTIYTEIFDKMEPTALARVYKRVYEELSKPQNRAALEILRDTKPNLPDYYR
ncbi:MAG: hypothetical protein ABIR70_03950 [Bryobacteraceae bacterium]